MFNCFHDFKFFEFLKQRKYRPVTTVCQQGGRVEDFFNRSIINIRETNYYLNRQILFCIFELSYSV